MRHTSTPRRRAAARSVRGTVVGALTAVLVLAGRQAGVVYGAPALGFAVLLAVCAPTASGLSRRILVAGALMLGWLPLLWWVPTSGARVDRIGIVLALAAGALASWVASAEDVRGRIKRLVPRLGAADAIPVVAVAGGIWALWPLLEVASGDRSLNLLIKSGWDHAPHFGMVRLIRAEGAISPVLGAAPDGSSWVGSGYPQHFHVLMAALTELTSGPGLGDTATEVLRYGRGLALVQILVAGLLAAGVAQLPELRKRPDVAWPVAGLVVALFLFGPGTIALTTGFPNFVLACAAVGMAVLLAAGMRGTVGPLHFAALGGLVVATAHGWFPLGPLVAAGVCAGLLPLARDRWEPVLERKLVSAVIVAVTAAASLAAVATLSSSGAGSALTAGGTPEFATATLLTATGAAIAVTLAPVVRRTQRSAARQIGLAAVPTTGLLLLAGLGAYQLSSSGELSYYFGKLATAVSLISVVVLAAGIATNISWSPARPRRRALTTVASVAMTVAVVELFGYVGPRAPDGFSVTDLAPMTAYRRDAEILTAGPSSESLRLLSAASVADARPFASTSYVAAMPADPIPLLADQWQRALSLNWSNRSDRVAATLDVGGAYASVDEAAEVTRELLLEEPRQAVVVAPEISADIRRQVPRSLRSRVISW